MKKFHVAILWEDSDEEADSATVWAADWDDACRQALALFSTACMVIAVTEVE